MRMRNLMPSIAMIAAAFLTAAAPATKPGDEILAPPIVAHFDSVLTELRSRDVSMLTSRQRENRDELIATLRAYRNRGVFPHNYDFPGQAVPYFVDTRTGTLCAMGHLIESTGRRDLVDRVARTNNNVLVRDLAGDTALAAWLDEHGLTLAEAARIQPQYGEIDEPLGVRTTTSRIPMVANFGGMGASMLSVLTNSRGAGRVRGWIGLGVGLGNVGLGIATVADRNADPMVGMANLGFGVLTTAFGAHSIGNAAAKNKEPARVAVAPLLPTKASGTGLSVHVLF